MRLYKDTYRTIYNHLKDSDDMDKYHILGTASSIKAINAIGGLPTRNYSSGRFEFADNISGEFFAENLLLRKVACSQCPVGCIHVAFLRVPYKKEEFDLETTFVSYDYEIIYALGSNLGIENASNVLRLIEDAERNGFDIISLGGILAWATDAYKEGIITSKDTNGINFNFGDTNNYLAAIDAIVARENEFYYTLGEGLNACIEKFGGKDYAISIGGQTPAGYFTGPASIIGHIIGQRHSHLCNAGYSLDQKTLTKTPSPKEIVYELVSEEKWRQILNSLVVCLFSRKVYNLERTIASLKSVGIETTENELMRLANETYNAKNEWKRAAGQTLSEKNLAERLFKTESPHGFLKRAFIKKALEYYSEISKIPLE